MSELRPTCGTCRFFVRDERPGYQDAGKCHRFPPQLSFAISPNGDEVHSQERPWLYETEWCGEHETTPIVARLDGRSGKSAEEAGTEIRQTADSPRPGDAGPDNKEPPPTGVDQHKCFGGGVVSENAGAASVPEDEYPRVALTYCGARVIDDGEIIRIELSHGPRGVRSALRRHGWKGSGGRWQTGATVSAIASARDILGRFYGEPI